MVIDINKRTEQCKQCRYYQESCEGCQKIFLNKTEDHKCPHCGKPAKRKCINKKMSGSVHWGLCEEFRRRFPPDMKIPKFVE